MSFPNVRSSPSNSQLPTCEPDKYNNIHDRNNNNINNYYNNHGHSSAQAVSTLTDSQTDDGVID